MHDTEDIGWWYEHGNRKEDFFVEKIAPLVGLDARINPAKEDDKTAPDLIISGKEAELKTQETPFFTAKKNCGVDPQYAVTFNHGDYLSYKRKHPDLDIYFMVNWQKLSYKTKQGLEITVMPLKAVYRVNFKEIQRQIESGQARLHEYLRRKGDPLNETHSYGLDLRSFELLKDFSESS